MKTSVVALCALLSLLGVAVANQVVLSPAATATNISSPDAWTLFKQCDSAWGSEKLGTCSQTICQAGCAMSSVAMILATRGWKGNPGTLNTWLKANGGYASGCDIIWATVDKLGYTSSQGSETASFATICSGVSAGHGVVINVRSNTHWVLVTGCSGSSTFTVNDPGFNQGTYAFGDASHEQVYH